MKAFTNHFQRAFQPIDVQAESMKESLHRITQSINPELNNALMAPIVLEELKTAISQGKPNKAPGVDGIGLEFHRMGWDIIETELLQIMNKMYSEQPLGAHQVRGLMVCIPKRSNPTRISDYRPLTLLNSDYKILARVLANRLKPILQDIISPQQHCGIQGTSIFEAVATIRDVIAYAETSQTPLCVISLDFQAAFDRVSHQYLEETLRAYGFSESFIRRIMGLYRNATTEIHINGFRSNSIPVKRSIRQGCPLSMLLYATCINHLLQTLEEGITGVKTGNGRTGITTVAYADDITIFLTRPDEIPKLQEILDTYQKASCAHINMDKSRAMALGEWDATRRIMNIPYYGEITILGFTFKSKSNTTNKEQWHRIISQVRAVAQDAYYRKLDLYMRIRYVHDYLLAKIWHTAQILPITAEGVRQLNCTIAWYIWRGEIFRMPLFTLQRSVDEGGWNLVNIWAKSIALFVLRLRTQGQREGTPTADWLKKWNISTKIQNPPYFGQVPAALG